MILVTTSQIPGMRIATALGIARGNTVRARHVGKDIMASLRNLAGGEIHEYTKLIAESREQALARLIDDASDLGSQCSRGIAFSDFFNPKWCIGNALLRDCSGGRIGSAFLGPIFFLKHKLLLALTSTGHLS